MKRLLLLIVIIFVILPFTCWLLRPTLTDIDFLTLDLTVFAISLALMTFSAPIMMRFRDMLLDMDAAVLKKDMGIIDFCKSTIENYEKIDALDPRDEYKQLIKTAKERLLEYTEKIKQPFPLSDRIQNYYKGSKNIIVWCMVAIVAHVVVNEVLFTSGPFVHFLKEYLSCITSGWDLASIKVVISSYIKLASLTLQFYFLFRTSDEAITAVVNFKAM